MRDTRHPGIRRTAEARGTPGQVPPGAGKRRRFTLGAIAYTEDFPRRLRGAACAWCSLSPMGNVGGGKSERTGPLAWGQSVRFRSVGRKRCASVTPSTTIVERSVERSGVTAPRATVRSRGGWLCVVRLGCSTRFTTSPALYDARCTIAAGDGVAGRGDATPSPPMEDEAVRP